MKYLKVRGPEDTTAYIGILYVIENTKGIAFDTSVILHLEMDLICEISSEFRVEFMKCFLGDDTFIDISKYQDAGKALVISPNDFDEDLDDESFEDDDLDKFFLGADAGVVDERDIDRDG